MQWEWDVFECLGKATPHAACGMACGLIQLNEMHVAGKSHFRIPFDLLRICTKPNLIIHLIHLFINLSMLL